LAAHAQELVAGRRVLELGSGTGIVGLTAAACGARRVVLSDWSSEVLALLEANRALFQQEAAGTDAGRCEVAVRRLRWGEPEHVLAAAEEEGPCELAIASECVYNEVHPPLLFATVDALLAHTPDALLLFAYISRREVSVIPLFFLLVSLSLSFSADTRQRRRWTRRWSGRRGRPGSSGRQ
jgi:predicted nicotinamide N-methyase